MKIAKIFWLGAATLLLALPTCAQQVGNPVRENYSHNWSFGAGINVVDDSGEFIGGIQDPSKNWNFSRPFYVSAEHYLNNEFSFMAMVSFNKYNEGKQIDGAELIGDEEPGYFAADLVAKYSFRDVLRSYKFDPYVGLGIGVTSFGSYQSLYTVNGESTIRDVDSRTNFNIVGSVGFNYWFNYTWGINLNLAGKWNLSNSFDDNHKQYALGAVYVLD